MNLNLNNKLYIEKIGSVIAFYAIFTETVIKSLLVYQESYWGWNETYNQLLFKYIVKIPVFVILSAIFCKSLINHWINKKVQIVSSFVVLFAVYLFIVVYINWNKSYLGEFNISNIHLIGNFGFYFLVGYYLSISNDLISKLKWVVFLGYLLLMLQIILFFDFSSFSINIANLGHNNYIHLLLGDAFTLWAIITLSVLNYNKRIVLYCISIFFIFALSSRAAFYCFLLVSPVIFYNKDKHIMKYFLLFSGLLILILFFSRSSLMEHRMFAVFSGHDVSVNNRIEIWKTNFQDIIRHFFGGAYGDFYNYKEPANTYIHNIFSFWNQFGFIPFIIIIYLFYLSLLEVREHIHSTSGSISFAIVTMSLYIQLSVLIAKAYTYPQFFLIIGFIGSYGHFGFQQNDQIEFGNKRGNFEETHTTLKE